MFTPTWESLPVALVLRVPLHVAEGVDAVDDELETGVVRVETVVEVGTAVEVTGLEVTTVLELDEEEEAAPGRH